MSLPERIVATLAPSAAERLGPLRELADALARSSGQRLFDAACERGILASRYRPFTNVPSERVPLGTLHADAASLVRALDEGEFGTWDAALDLLAAVDEPATDALAGAVFAANYWAWPELGERALGLLMRSPSDAALAGLLAGLAAEVPLRFDLAMHPHPQLGERLHAALRAWGATTFEPFTWPSVDAWDAMTSAEQRAFDRAREEAGRRAPAPGPVRALLLALRRVDPPSLLPDLLAMATGHPAPALRQAALTSLLGRPEEEAKRVLRAALDDAKGFVTGVSFVVRTEPESAYERFSPWFVPERVERATAREAARAVLNALREDAEGAATCRLAADPRWLDVLVAHEKTEGLDVWSLLRRFDPQEVALARARLRALRRRTPGPRLARPGAYLARYRAGEHEAVWRELLEAGDLPERAPLREEALAVARETMTRVRDDLDALGERLAEEGLVPSGSVRAPPDPSALATLQHAFGPLPLSLAAFFEIVGSVSLALSPDAPETSTVERLRLAQPLVVIPVREAASLLGEPSEERRDAPRYLYLAADECGGPPYSIRLPSEACDALLLHEPHGLPFVAYLRVCLRWGGFPGLERAARKPRTLLARLTRDLRPF